MTYAVVGKFAKRKGLKKDKYKSVKVSESSLNGLLVCVICGYQEMRPNSGAVKENVGTYGDENGALASRALSALTV